MNVEFLTSKFGQIGARLRVRPLAPALWNRRTRDYSIDVVTTRKGETFDFVVTEDDLDVRVVDVNPTDRHLLLLVNSQAAPDPRKFLCGHDERHWFVAGVDRSASSVREAMEVLKPREVLVQQARKRVKSKSRNRRRNAAFIRQGEWFFVPAPDLTPDERLVRHKEPIRRGRAKPHRVEFLFRRGGVSVRVCREYPNGLTEGEYAALIRREPKKAKRHWRNMTREPEAFAKGRVRHPDHKTIVLRGWHRILPSHEVGTNVAFLD